ncbi:MAG TPA: efflux RND transporter periplasmic adaptor subunit [Alphaproteobacteria bacterium]|jgi:multidrug efflux system membrane fusion protein|nr:efflux RND transporter periplasmic adaptor subunit [Alphaproteobacteria bacterium]
MKLQKKYLVGAGAALLLAVVGYRIANHKDDSADAQALNKPIPIVAGKVDVGDVPLYVVGVGTVQAYNTVNILARVDGQLDSVDFREGQDVKTGDKLAQIDPRPFQAALDAALGTLAKDQATLTNAKRDLARYQDTASKGFSSRQQLDTQAALVDSTNAQIQADQAAVENARVQLGYTTIASPIDGRTGIRHIDKGNIVHAADTTGLVVITQLQPISVIFTLPQDALPRVAAAEQAAGATPLNVTAFARDGVTELGQGVLELVDNQIDQTTGTIRLKARFANPDRSLWPGEFVNARLQVGTVHDGLVVDSRVVQRGPKGVFAYVIKPDSSVEMRMIEPGQDYGGHTLVTKGLAADERVVVDGQMRLQAGSKVDTSAQDKPVQTGSNTAPVPTATGAQ